MDNPHALYSTHLSLVHCSWLNIACKELKQNGSVLSRALAEQLKYELSLRVAIGIFLAPNPS